MLQTTRYSKDRSNLVKNQSSLHRCSTRTLLSLKPTRRSRLRYSNNSYQQKNNKNILSILKTLKRKTLSSAPTMKIVMVYLLKIVEESQLRILISFPQKTNAKVTMIRLGKTSWSLRFCRIPKKIIISKSRSLTTCENTGQRLTKLI